MSQSKIAHLLDLYVNEGHLLNKKSAETVDWFIRSQGIKPSKKQIRANLIYSTFVEWCDRKGVFYVPTETLFGIEFGKHFCKIRGNRGWYYHVEFGD